MKARTLKIAPPTRTPLEDAEFDKLRALVGIVAEIERDAMRAALEFDRRMADAKGKAHAAFLAVTKAHGLDPNLDYRLDDEARALCVVPKGA